MICITFDTDHMRQADMSRFMELLADLMPGQATFFLHDIFPQLFETKHELAPHPLIENLSTWDSDLKHLQQSIPRPVYGVRPHSCVFSHLIGTGLKRDGYAYISQAQNLFEDGLRPFRHPWGIWELPIYYMDSMDFWICKNWPELNHRPFSPSVINLAMSSDSLFVFDFHPLHIALNTRTHEHYQEAKSLILGPGAKSPFDLAAPGLGTGKYFQDLCEKMRSSNLRSHTLADALTHFST